MSRRDRRHDPLRELVLLAAAAAAAVLVGRALRRPGDGAPGSPVRWWEVARGPHGITEP